jgi:hypothetical protein
VVVLDCKKCPYYEPKKEITNTGKVVVGMCKLRGKHMTDLTIRKELCKDRATVDIPANTRTINLLPEKTLFTDNEAAQVEAAKATVKPEGTAAGRRPAGFSSRPRPSADAPTLGQLAEKRMAEKAAKLNPPAPPSKADIMRQKERERMERWEENQRKVLSKDSETEKPRERQSQPQIVPPMKLNPQEAMKLLDQQLSGKINAKFTKGGMDDKQSDKDIVRKAVWGGG